MLERFALIFLFALVALLGVLRPAAVAAVTVLDDAAAVVALADTSEVHDRDASPYADDSEAGDDEPAVPAERMVVAFDLHLAGAHRSAALLYEPPHRDPSVPPII